MVHNTHCCAEQVGTTEGCLSILTMSMEFDKNFSNSTDHKNGFEKKFEHFWSKLLDPRNCKILTFKVIFLCQTLSESF
jgi:hypothetical protein